MLSSGQIRPMMLDMRTRLPARRRSLTLSVAAALALLTAGLVPSAAQAAQAAPATSSPGQRVIVRLVPGSDAAALARQVSGTVGPAAVSQLYATAVDGFAATLPATVVETLRRNPSVVSVEPDVVVRTAATQRPTPSWGLDRIDQAKLPLSSTFTTSAEGKGVTAYVVDTGLRADHVDFTGRVRAGFSAVSDGQGTTDCNGHGTHVAGTLAGRTYGVAKSATVVPVRVLDCAGSGLFSQVVAGIDWVVRDHKAGVPAVANLSVGGPAGAALDEAVKALVADGVTVVVAAGNANVDACTTSPARVPAVLTVGATTSTDARASYSNWGKCLDLFAPGSAIVSASATSTTGSATMSGTSMATPHVAGSAAVLLSKQPTLSPGAVAYSLTHFSTPGVVTSPGTASPNRLLRVS
jgi:subtilisin family serine protease